MPRYFFNLSGPSATITDQEGEELGSLKEAYAVGRETAYELARNRDDSDIAGYCISVVDEHGQEHFAIPLSLFCKELVDVEFEHGGKSADTRLN